MADGEQLTRRDASAVADDAERFLARHAAALRPFESALLGALGRLRTDVRGEVEAQAHAGAIAAGDSRRVPTELDALLVCRRLRGEPQSRQSHGSCVAQAPP
jgi:hypothetical protein